MLALPVRRSQHLDNDTSPHPSPPTLQISNVQNSRQNETARTMTSATPVMRPPTQGARKPRLTLNTANVPSLPSGARSKTALCMSAVTGSPTYRNTYANAFEAAPVKTSTSLPANTTSPLSKATEHSASPRSASTSTSTTSSTSDSPSPFPAAAPYILPVGSRGILRNSPFPRRQAVGSRPPKVYFPPVKRVGFQDSNLVQYIPSMLSRREGTPESSSDASDPDTSPKRKHDPISDDYDEISERRQLDELLEERQNVSSPIHGRRKRRREWVWRPLDNDILERHHSLHSPTAEKHSSHSPRLAAIDLPAEGIPLPRSPPFTTPSPSAEDKPPSAPVLESPPMFLPAATYSPPPILSCSARRLEDR